MFSYYLPTYINRPVDEVEHVFRIHNQPTIIFLENNILKRFGTNEGGPCYHIYLDKNGVVIDIQEIDYLSYL